ncbi:MAG: hypothetical protein PHX87_06250 [Candidatus Peribacteraceae bacterium]|nr:hypothetical protein [Candidatus Peribacteraceae bacterium]MDD5742992.1 hypothetical protein [Candidatus Peribacteraceae bacterium]
MVNLLIHRAPDGTPVSVNQVDGRPSSVELQQQADASRNAVVVVNHTTGEIRRKCDDTILQPAQSQE